MALVTAQFRRNALEPPSPILLKHIIYGPLADIINMSVQSGVFPSKLEQAKAIPVTKGDDKTDPGNYRAISLLSIFNRILEKLMYHRLKAFLDKNDILFKVTVYLQRCLAP